MENNGTEHGDALSRVSSTPTDFKREDGRTGLEESALRKSSRLDFFSKCLYPSIYKALLSVCPQLLVIKHFYNVSFKGFAYRNVPSF